MRYYTPKEIAKIEQFLETKPNRKQRITFANKFGRPVQGLLDKMNRMGKSKGKTIIPKVVKPSKTTLEIVSVLEDTPIQIQGVQFTFPGNKMIFNGASLSW